MIVQCLRGVIASPTQESTMYDEFSRLVEQDGSLATAVVRGLIVAAPFSGSVFRKDGPLQPKMYSTWEIANGV